MFSNLNVSNDRVLIWQKSMASASSQGAEFFKLLKFDDSDSQTKILLYFASVLSDTETPSCSKQPILCKFGLNSWLL